MSDTNTYIGCYNDGGPNGSNKSVNSRALPNFRGDVKTVKDCQNLAEKYGDILFGLQYGGQCFTGNDIVFATQWGQASGNSNCNPVLGGSWVNQIYSLNPVPPTYIGCFHDNSQQRVLPNQRQDSGATVQSCHLLAIQNGDTLFGIEQGKCFTGNDIVSATKYGESPACDSNSIQLYSINPNAISNNLTNQYQQQLNTLQTQLGITDASYISMNLNWQTNYNQLQNQLVNTVSELSQVKLNASNTAMDLSLAQTNLYDMVNSVSSANSRIGNQFINSQDIQMKESFDTIANYENNIQNLNNIVMNEQERLVAKKKAVDDAFFTQKRNIEFNENIRKRTRVYNYIGMVFVIALFLCVIILFLSKIFPFVPVVFLISLILGVAIILSFRTYYDISSRWNMDYDVYNLNSPNIVNQPIVKITTGGQTMDASMNSLATCVGQSCCSTGTVWQNGSCVSHP